MRCCASGVQITTFIHSCGNWNQMNDRHDNPYDDFSVLTVLAVPLRRWKLVVTVLVSGILLVGLWVYSKPREYVAHALLLPPKQDTQNPFMTDLAAGLPFGLGASLDEGGDQPRIITIMESRSVVDSIVKWTGLVEKYDVERHAAAASLLSERTQIEGKSDGSIIVRVTDGDPETAAEVANTYPKALNAVNYRLSAETAQQKIEYLQSQLAAAADELELVEQRLVEFRRESPAIEQQTSETVKAAAELQKRILETELHIARLRRFATPENPTLRDAVAELAALESQLQELTRRQGPDQSPVFLSFSEAPEFGLTYTRLMREFEKSQQVYKSLTVGLVQAQIDAKDDVPVINVLDSAVAPSSPSAPNRRRAVQLAALASLFIGLAGAYLADWGGRARSNPANREFFDAWDEAARGIREKIWNPVRSAFDRTRSD